MPAEMVHMSTVLAQDHFYSDFCGLPSIFQTQAELMFIIDNVFCCESIFTSGCMSSKCAGWLNGCGWLSCCFQKVEYRVYANNIILQVLREFFGFVCVRVCEARFLLWQYECRRLWIYLKWLGDLRQSYVLVSVFLNVHVCLRVCRLWMFVCVFLSLSESRAWSIWANNIICIGCVTIWVSSPVYIFQMIAWSEAVKYVSECFLECACVPARVPSVNLCVCVVLWLSESRAWSLWANNIMLHRLREFSLVF